jgi:hypothetical protein
MNFITPATIDNLKIDSLVEYKGIDDCIWQVKRIESNNRVWIEVVKSTNPTWRTGEGGYCEPSRLMVEGNITNQEALVFLHKEDLNG